MQIAGNRKKILFVAPFAHYDGHHCYVASSESEALSNAGEEVLLLTFNGLIDDSILASVRTKSLISLDRRQIVNKINSHELTKWPFMFISALATLVTAVLIYKKDGFDIIHLRDADPFPFLPWIVGLITNNTRWVVSVLSTLEGVPIAGPLSRFPLWRIICKMSIANHNRYLYVCQNEEVRNYYSKRFQGGLLCGRVYELLPMIPAPSYSLENKSRITAMERLGLPSEKTVFLSFGSVHRGKDPETIFSALKSIPDAICLHAGKTTLNMVPMFENLKKQYNSNVMFRDDYVAETEKVYYFAASSAVVLSYTKEFKATSSMLWEACRYQIPIIASDSGQLGNFVRSFDLGLTFESQNPASLHDAISKFMSFDNARITAIRRNCDRFRSDFSNEKWATRCEELYRKLE